jgi:hypothetical protein
MKYLMNIFDAILLCSSTLCQDALTLEQALVNS